MFEMFLSKPRVALALALALASAAPAFAAGGRDGIESLLRPPQPFHRKPIGSPRGGHGVTPISKPCG